MSIICEHQKYLIRDQLEHRETYLFIQYFEEAIEARLIHRITKHGGKSNRSTISMLHEDAMSCWWFTLLNSKPNKRVACTIKQKRGFRLVSPSFLLAHSNPSSLRPFPASFSSPIRGTIFVLTFQTDCNLSLPRKQKKRGSQRRVFFPGRFSAQRQIAFSRYFMWYYSRYSCFPYPVKSSVIRPVSFSRHILNMTM